MIWAPATGCSASKRARAASAGGQDEHPSEVNSSTSTGTRPVLGAFDVASSIDARTMGMRNAICVEFGERQRRYGMPPNGRSVPVRQFGEACEFGRGIAPETGPPDLVAVAAAAATPHDRDAPTPNRTPTRLL